MSMQIRYFSFYQLTRRLPHEDGVAPQRDPWPARWAHLNYDDERLLIHFYDTFYNESIKLLGCTVRCRVNVLYHLMAKIGKEPNADQRTEEEIKFIFENLGWDYSPIKLV